MPVIHGFDSHFTHIHVIDAYNRDSRMGKEGDEQIEGAGYFLPHLIVGKFHLV